MDDLSAFSLSGKLRNDDDFSLVSVIIPTFNRARYVGEAIESALAQTYSNLEVIVIDDGSVDNTQEVLKKYTSNIRIISQRNKGVSSARNTGIKAANGEWIAFLDSDDTWSPDKVSFQMSEIAQIPDLCAHISNVSIVKANGDSFDHFKIDNNNTCQCFILENSIRHLLRYHVFLTGAVFRNKSVVDAGMFDETLKIWEDYDFALRMTQQGSWCATNTVLSKVIRRDEPPIDITHIITSNRITSNFALIDVLNKFKNAYKDSIDKPTLRLLNNKMGELYFETACEFIKIKKKNFRKFIIKAFILNNSLKSFVKSSLLFLFGQFGLKIYTHRHRNIFSSNR